MVKLRLKVPPILYHGTTSKKLSKILKHGLQPKIPPKRKWRGIKDRSKVVSLTNTYDSALYWANKTANYDKGTPVVLKINIVNTGLKPHLRTTLVYPSNFDTEKVFGEQVPMLKSDLEFTVRKTIKPEFIEVMA